MVRMSRAWRWSVTWCLERGGALALAVLVTYVWLAPTTVVDGDNAEFATAGAVGGRPHPSGYPAYVLYLRATAWIPGASPAHTAAIATALLGALAVLVLHAACRAWGARAHAATIACAMFAASPVVLRMHIEAEVFAMNALVVALVLWLAAARGPVRGIPRGALLGLVAGIGMGNHLTCVLIAPVGLLGVLRAVRERETGKPLPALGALVGLALGLATYGYLVIADGPASFGRVDGFGDILYFFLREDYGGPGSFVPTGAVVAATTNLAALVGTLGRAWLWGPGLAGLAMLVIGVWRPPADGDGEPRWGWIMLGVSFALAGPLLVYRFNIEPKGLGLYVCQRFHLLPALLLVVPVGVGLDRIAALVSARVTLSRLGAAGVGSALGVVIYLGLVAVALPRLRAVHSPALELGARNLLAPLPPNAVVIAASEDLCFAVEYLQVAEGVRPDVQFVCWILTSRDWYHARLASQGLTLVTKRFVLETPATEADAILATGRPLFVDRSHRKLLAARPSYPFGIVARILPRGEEPPPLPEVVELNRKIYDAFALDYPRPGRSDDYAAMAHRRYAATWLTLAEALGRVGNPAAAAEATELARQLAPANE